MPAFRIGTQLDFIDGGKVCAHAFGHRLDRANPVFRPWRNDPFLACHQRHNGRAARHDDLVIDLARQQPQRQADNAGFVRQHPFDCVVGFSGIGRAKDGRDPRALRHKAEVSLSDYSVVPREWAAKRSRASSTSLSCGRIDNALS